MPILALEVPAIGRAINGQGFCTTDFIVPHTKTLSLTFFLILQVADNAILPLQLYVSSLDGQGLGMANSYAKQMKQDAAAYEKAYKEFVKALGKQNSAALLTAVTDMAVAVASYRQTGGLRDDDGNIPSVDEMRRMAMRKPTVALPTTYK